LRRGKRGHDYSSWPSVYVWTWSYEANSCIAFDLALTTLLMPLMCTLLATAGVLKDVRDKKCETVEPAMFEAGFWRWTPVRIRSLCLRSLAQALYWTVLAFPPTILVLWAAVQNGPMAGLTYVVFKGIWAMLLAWPMFHIVFFAGLDKRNFPELEFEALMRLTSKAGADAPPLVGQVGRV
jgi:hypothetical protein